MILNCISKKDKITFYIFFIIDINIISMIYKYHINDIYVKTSLLHQYVQIIVINIVYQ